MKRLQDSLNFSVFYYEVLNDHKTACKIAEDTIKKAEPDVQNLDEDLDENKDTVSIVNLLRENLEMWKSESNEEEQ